VIYSFYVLFVLQSFYVLYSIDINFTSEKKNNTVFSYFEFSLQATINHTDDMRSKNFLFISFF